MKGFPFETLSIFPRRLAQEVLTSVRITRSDKKRLIMRTRRKGKGTRNSQLDKEKIRGGRHKEGACGGE